MNDEQLYSLLDELVSLPEETEWVEFKLNKGSISSEQIGEYISAMSNGATISNKPFGYLVWGVQDGTHAVAGTNFSFFAAKKGNQDLELWLRNLLYPKVNIEIYEFMYHGKRIVLIRIPAAKGEPTHFQKKAYIRIAMHNCIAHQDYSLNSRIIVTEKIDKLIFSNAGSFFEGNPEDYTAGDKTPERYRNSWLANAMVNLGMIDRLGYGIHTIYLSQRNRFFPMPDYLLSDRSKVVLQIYGHAIDENYSKLLIERKDLPLDRIVLLDKVQKKQAITEKAASVLRKEKLIEGRKPNYFVAASVAEATNEKAIYIKNKAFDKAYYKDLIIEFIVKYKHASRDDIDNLLMEKLSNVLNEDQKRNKIRNLLYEMSKKDKTIFNRNRSTAKPMWVLTKNNTGLDKD